MRTKNAVAASNFSIRCVRPYVIPLLFVLIISILGGCSLFATAPLDTLYYQRDEKPSSTLVIFLRGIGGSHKSFAGHGLVEAVWERHLDVDMAAPNTHIGYYSARNMIERLQEDVIRPAREMGYQKVWLVGVSMGGLGALLYLREHPEEIAGVYIIAPFLGYESIVSSIEKEGGVDRWKVPSYTPEDDWETMIWDWIKTSVADGRTPPVYLGYGSHDDYVRGQKLLHSVLPESQVYVIDGGHDYPTFKTLWFSFLDGASVFSSD